MRLNVIGYYRRKNRTNLMHSTVYQKMLKFIAIVIETL